MFFAPRLPICFSVEFSHCFLRDIFVRQTTTQEQIADLGEDAPRSKINRMSKSVCQDEEGSDLASPRLAKGQEFRWARYDCLQDGVAQWKAYAALASAQYSYPQLLARVRVLDVVGFTAGAERDVQLAAGARGA